MKLTEELKQKINDYFESKSEEEVYEILKSYGINVQKQKNIEERPIGDILEFDGKMFKVVRSMDSACFGCYFNTTRGCRYQNAKGLGPCDKIDRSDNNYIKFIQL